MYVHFNILFPRSTFWIDSPSTFRRFTACLWADFSHFSSLSSITWGFSSYAWHLGWNNKPWVHDVISSLPSRSTGWLPPLLDPGMEVGIPDITRDTHSLTGAAAKGKWLREKFPATLVPVSSLSCWALDRRGVMWPGEDKPESSLSVLCTRSAEMEPAGSTGPPSLPPNPKLEQSCGLSGDWLRWVWSGNRVSSSYWQTKSTPCIFEQVQTHWINVRSVVNMGRFSYFNSQGKSQQN